MNTLNKQEWLIKSLKEQTGLNLIETFKSFIKLYLLAQKEQAQPDAFTLVQCIDYVLENLPWQNRVFDEGTIKTLKNSLKLILIEEGGDYE